MSEDLAFETPIVGLQVHGGQNLNWKDVSCQSGRIACMIVTCFEGNVNETG
jgi:hypothetical protein